MKAAPFDYVRAGSLAEVFDLLEDRELDSRILAGGQSLLATLALRLSEPSVLIDIGGLEKLHFIEERGGAVHIGALTRHCELERNALVAQRLPLIAQAILHVAHPAIRNRGTIGGSLSLADPAAELPACSAGAGCNDRARLACRRAARSRRGFLSGFLPHRHQARGTAAYALKSRRMSRHGGSTSPSSAGGAAITPW